MSWGFSVPVTPVSEFENAAQVASGPVRVASDEWAEHQMDVAIHAATAIVASGVVGSGVVTVTISGHANPDHKPSEHYANDYISVVLNCADPR